MEWPLLDGVVAHRLSARTGDGVDAWLDRVLGGDVAAGALPLVTLDYARYAAAEAALAWLNWHAQVQLTTPTAPCVVVGVLADRLERELSRARLAIAHVKILDQTESGYVRVSLCGDGRAPAVDGVLDAAPAVKHQLLVNARVVGDPDVLSRVVEESLRGLGGEVQLGAARSVPPCAPATGTASNHLMLGMLNAGGTWGRSVAWLDSPR